MSDLLACACIGLAIYGFIWFVLRLVVIVDSGRPKR